MASTLDLNPEAKVQSEGSLTQPSAFVIPFWFGGASFCDFSNVVPRLEQVGKH